mmetsp:Transcript_60817/g.188269  ORF Transcript_60817/g.188269 Transcript_60817/m.188269 type:complete len:205 (+) Transcript_60817:318-932(+)
MVPGDGLEDAVHRGHAAEDAGLLDAARVLLRAEPQREPPGGVEEGAGVEAVLRGAGGDRLAHGLRVLRARQVRHEANNLAVFRSAAGGDVEEHYLVRTRGPLDPQEEDVPGLVAGAVDQAGDLVQQPVHHEQLMVHDEERLARQPALADRLAHALGAPGAEARHLALVGPAQGLQLCARVHTAPAENHELRRTQVLRLCLELGT